MAIDTIAVIGSGTMGHGIAQVAAQAGYTTFIYDIDEGRVRKAIDTIRDNLSKGVEKGKVEAGVRDATLAKLKGTANLKEAVASADLVIEAVPEQLDLKRKVFNDLDTVCKPGCIYASNTSSLSVSALADGVKRPAQFIGMHFFNPVHIMALLEIVVAKQTSDATLAAAKEAGKRMGKECIVVKDSPGFASSRLGIVLGLEAMRMFEQGVASAEDIDKAMELGYRHPMGPLKLTDLVGLDVRLGIAEYLHRELASEAFNPPKILRDMVAQGKLGKKSGQGFYKW
ncbi:MAG: 3-hydroxyacyl-CoA dehydrogenase family protein [Planctomycetes bacterium]|nr:3-hydroxyacyl-CoA dehydrogenase family protein [Planctomycetota bacterium]NUQ33679.1 3-hydroxyacyl-CoA dehydrogenase family protein [Planctomycetaceae bacterium]